MSAYESLYNAALSDLLRQQGLYAPRRKPRSNRKRVDLLVRTDGSLVAVEGEIANRDGAVKDARARLKQKVADAAVAVSYPKLEDPGRDLKFLEAAEVGEETTGEWRKTDMAGLADLIRAAGKMPDFQRRGACYNNMEAESDLFPQWKRNGKPGPPPNTTTCNCRGCRNGAPVAR